MTAAEFATHNNLLYLEGCVIDYVACREKGLRIHNLREARRALDILIGHEERRADTDISELAP